ncbi:histidine kinase sensor domain-containing protein, partial [Photobacterium sp. ZSDE20]|nr:histidine kinase sensor domain-containing protein [Photobacterium sp. ZSDE20]
KYYLFVLDDDQYAICGCNMHPHFVFKLQYARGIDTAFDNEINQPTEGVSCQRCKKSPMVNIGLRVISLDVLYR